MISLGSRDENKGLGLGLGFGKGRRMEDTELEEGEACFYQDDGAANFDPDVALAYIDEKVQDVLGHFQKDFEGVVSAENLGAKFGCYGSFLPTHQRSPSIWSHPRTPQKIQNNGAPISPNNSSIEGARQNIAAVSSTTLSTKVGPPSTSAPPLAVSRAPSVENSLRRDAYLSSAGSAEFTPKKEPAKKLMNSTNHKPLKVRIKVGPENTAHRNASIYSGLGLDISPSSSPDDSPIENEGLSPESRNTLEKSPVSILQVMASFPVEGDFLLSPLSDSLLHFMGKESLRKGDKGSSLMPVEDPHSLRWQEKLLVDKKIKSGERNRSVEVKNRNSKDARNEIGAFLKKEIDIETPSVKDHVSNDLKLPNLSDSKCNGETAKGTIRACDEVRERNISVLKDEMFSSDSAKEEVLDAAGKTKSSSVQVLEDRKSSYQKDAQVVPKKEGRKNFDKSNDIFQTEFDGSKGRKENSVSIDHPKEKFGKKQISSEQDRTKMDRGKEQPSSRGKNKVKGMQSNGNSSEDSKKGRSRVVSSATSKDKKKNDGDYLSETKLYDNRSQSGQTRGTQKDLLANVKVENGKNMQEAPFRDRPRETKYEVAEKERPPFADKSKEKSTGKKVDNNALNPEAYPKALLGSSHSTMDVPGSNSVPVTAAPVVINENWVACDRCEKWRLLPYGTDAKDLPNWTCSMLYWLPGMNRCAISEEETTKALRSLYQIPIPESQNIQLSQPDLAIPGVALEAEPTHQDHIRSIGKKKHGPKEIQNAVSRTGAMQFRDQKVSMRNRSISDDMNHSPLESNQGSRGRIQYKSSDSGVEKQRQRQKEGHTPIQDGGGSNSKYFKSKNRRDVDLVSNKSSKKMRTDGLSCSYEDMESDHGGIIGEMPPNSNNGSAQVTGKYGTKLDTHTLSKNTRSDVKDNLPVTVRKPVDSVQISLDGRALHTGNSNKMNMAGKKRKVEEWQENLPETQLNNENHVQYNKSLSKEVTSESESRKEKKARVHKSEESKTSKGNDQTDKKGKITHIDMSDSRNPVGGGREEGRGIKDQHVGYGNVKSVSQRTLDGIDPSKRGSGYAESSTAATSTSSKVSDSHRSKGNFREVKGSPAESVSSSPLRILNPDKVTSTRNIALVKDDAANVNFTFGSQERFSDDVGDGRSRGTGTLGKEKAPANHHESIELSVLNYQERDANHISVVKAKNTEPPLYEPDNDLTAAAGDFVDKHNKYPGERQGKENDQEERGNNNHCRSKGSLPKSSSKVSSSRSKDKQKGLKSDGGKAKNKAPRLLNERDKLHRTNNSRDGEVELLKHTPYHGESRDEKYNLQYACGVKSGKDETNHSDRLSAGNWSSEGGKDTQSILGHDGSNVKSGASLKDGKSKPPRKLLQDHEAEKSSKRFLSEKEDQTHTQLGRGKSQLVPQAGDKQETLTQCSRLTQGTSVGCDGEASKIPKQPRRPDNQNGVNHIGLRSSITNGLGSDISAPSPVRKDSSTQAAASALKEAKDLKHSADRHMNVGSIHETTSLYFQAALKFLHGASLLETCNSESVKYGDMTHSMEVYSTTAKLCGFVAHEYERCKEMAAAALAYKCMEVAYMRVIYFKHSSASKDRHELQTALQIASSDNDNSNQRTSNKLGSAKDVNSHVGENHVIVAKSRPNFVRLLNFTEDVNFAMEASRKYQSAFAAANVSIEETRYEPIRRALDFNFHDVQGLLRLVRLAVEAISR